jgi:hypothetical protein
MAALPAHYLEMLKQELRDHFVPYLPPLLDSNKPVDDQAKKQLSRAFSAFALHKHLDVSARTAAESVIDDFNDGGIDAIFYVSGREALYLVQSKLKASEEFSQVDAQAFVTGVRHLLRQDFSTFNKNVLQRQTELESALGACSTIRLLIAYTGSAVSEHARNALNDVFTDTDVDEERLTSPFETFGPEDVTKALLEQQAHKPINTEIHLQHSGKLKEPRTTYYGVVKLQDLVILHQRHGKSLYEKNIRYFLGSRSSPVNRDIQSTLRDEPASFFYLNNGVTALCSRIDPKGNKMHSQTKKLSVLGFSIINGAQTVASAAELIAGKTAPDISEAKVLLTLIEAKADGAFGPHITRARNNQNPVLAANFASLDPQQERLRQELAYCGIQYHYRPEAIAVSDDKSILLQDALLALSWLQPDPRYVVWLKSSPASIADADSQIYKTLFMESLTGCKLANAVFYARTIQQLARASEQSSKGIEKLTYRHGVHAIGSVLVKRLAKKIDASQVIDRGQIRVQISVPFDELRQQCVDVFRSTHSDKGPLAFFKNQTETVPFLARVMEQNYGLANHPALPALKQAKKTDQFPQEGLFRFMASHALQI